MIMENLMDQKALLPVGFSAEGRKADSGMASYTYVVVKCCHGYCRFSLELAATILLRDRAREPKTVAIATQEHGVTSKKKDSREFSDHSHKTIPASASVGIYMDRIRSDHPQHFMHLHLSVQKCGMTSKNRFTLAMNEAGHSHKTTPPSAVREHGSQRWSHRTVRSIT